VSSSRLVSLSCILLGLLCALKSRGRHRWSILLSVLLIGRARISLRGSNELPTFVRKQRYHWNPKN
jgi:hypothetical protein